LAGAPGRGTLEKNKPPILGLIQRGGQVLLRMLANVQQATTKPTITAAVTEGSVIHTDEYAIYARLPSWGYRHKTVCHGRGEYARDEDGDGFCEVHVNTMEGFWSLLRSWLRPHRGISKDKLPLYLGFFEFVHNARRRGKACLAPSSRAWLRDELLTTPEPIKSHGSLAPSAPATKPKGPHDVGANGQVGDRLATETTHPSSLAEPAVRRQTLKVGAVCGNSRSHGSVRGARSDGRPLYVAACLASNGISPSSKESGEPHVSLRSTNLCGR